MVTTVTFLIYLHADSTAMWPIIESAPKRNLDYKLKWEQNISQ